MQPIMEYPFDPIERSKKVESEVMVDSRRKYQRFRFARYYGGISTADVVGCNLLCAYCWNYRRNRDPLGTPGFFLSPLEVARRLIKILKNKKGNKVRISGGETALGKKSFFHLLDLIREVLEIEPNVDFILETNGILFGIYPEFAKTLSKFKRVYVRVSLKGYDPESFERISGAKREYFESQILGLRNLQTAGVYAWPACMFEVFGPSGIGEVSRVLREFRASSEELEIEYLEPYPFVLENLSKRGVPLMVTPNPFLSR